MSLGENADINRRSVFRLTVAGLKVRYYSGTVAPTLESVPGTGGALSYDDNPGLVAVSSVTGRLDPKGGVAEQGPMTVSLATTDDPRSVNEAGRVLSRITQKAAAFWAQLLTKLDQATGAGTVEIDRSHASVTVPTLIHVGLETMGATAKLGTGAPADPYRFTVTRAVAGTQPQVHRVDGAGGKVPLVIIDEVVFWRTRRASVHMAQIRSDGTLSEWVEIKRGFIERSPRETGSPKRLEVEVIDLLTLTDTAMVNNNVSTGLRDNWHEWTYPHACTMVHAQRWAWQGDATSVAHSANAGAAGVYNVAPGQLAPHQGTMDTGLPGQHPRRGQLWNDHGGAFEVVTGYGIGTGPAGDDQFIIAAPGPTRLGAAGDLINSAPAVEVIPVDVAPGPVGTQTLARWPDAAVDAAQASWVPRSFAGAGGMWANMTIDAEGDDGPALLSAYNVDNYRRALRILLWSDWQAVPEAYGFPHANFKAWRTPSSPAAASGPDDPPDLFRHLWYGLDFADPGDEARPFRHHGVIGARGPWRGPRRAEWVREVALFTEADTGRVPAGPAEQRIPIRGIASAFYQTGEPSILVSDQVVVPPGGVHKMTVTYWDGEEERTHDVSVTAATEVFDGGVSIGWRLTIQDPYRTPSFGNWPGQEPAAIRSAIRFDAERPAVVLLQLLLSGGGGLINDSVYDVLPIGANLVGDASTSPDVDVASFERFPDTPGMDRWTLTYPDGETVREVLEDMLMAMGAAIVSRIDPDTGDSMLTLVSVGPENPMETLSTISTADPTADISRSIADGDWLVDPVPESGTDDEIVNKWVFNLSHPAEDNDEPLPVIQYDQASITAHGDGEEVELNLLGIVADPAAPGGAEAAVQDILSRLMVQFGDERRTWRGRIATGDAIFGHLGSVYLVASRFLRAYGAVGLSAIGEDGTAVSFNAGRVMEWTIDYWGEGAEVLMYHYGVNGAGWAASAEVTAVVDPTTVRIDFSDFTPATHPVTGEPFRDIHGFFATQQVRGFNPADRDAAVALTVMSTDGVSHITFTGAHGLVAGDIIIPGSYDQVVNRLYAHMADAAATLGASADAAKDMT